MALTSRITLTGGLGEDPEDYFGSSLGVIFPDDVMNQHGDADSSILYQSPHLPRPLHITLATPDGDDTRRLFSHYLWNSSLLLAELVEAGTLGLGLSGAQPKEGEEEEGGGGGGGGGGGRGGGEGKGEGSPRQDKSPPLGPPLSDFNVAGLTTAELGAGTALPSLLSALLGARRVLVTDYPAPAVISNLKDNVARNARAELSPGGAGGAGGGGCEPDVEADGHSWGDFSTPLAAGNHHAFDRVFVCDCLWMPWQHENLQRSVEWFLRDGAGARAWVVAGFHTGREKMRGFFEGEALGRVGLEVERIWERDCDGVEREWSWDRGFEDPVGRKRWLACAVLRRRAAGRGDGEA
ncbi:hypothetical protein SLS53_000401 [Cytospora paraplurivora]|uniref:Nicotinamide N-methyltransferase n=1 Tax=Cytospora paraplurivora TaxID=2898453 RepID=A0AAN9UMT3_9PEZI